MSAFIRRQLPAFVAAQRFGGKPLRSKWSYLSIFDVVKSGEINEIDISHIRNFSVIAHIDRKCSFGSTPYMIL